VLIEDLTLAQLDNYYLQGTLETIPEFSQVLSIFENSAPLIIELKTQGDNYAQLCKAVCKHLDSYSGKYCIESFDARCVYWFRKNRPDVIRGQLASNFMKHGAVDKPWLLRFAATNHFLNFLTKPDFIAYRFSDRRNFFTWICRKLWEMQGVAWTITSKRDYQNAVKEGWIPIFEKIMP
jgi:glycerophosphoryl diester phosphodiesterase